MPTIDVQTELESGRGWRYLCIVRHDSGARTEHTVNLSWVDHDFWSGGTIAPSRVVQAVLEYVLTHHPADSWPPAFDAARARRWCPHLDQEIRSAL